ncbi:hypothetical protein JOB18_006605 [Solea senegalensis]|uniref:Uncharacterized protein n=1 Tax=Solea senegalensis TaxID=28829 RepID=A0AAV6PUP6_SOLSE|nr:hypothetical protein JOB18_006605 [Solea senegalensis]
MLVTTYLQHNLNNNNNSGERARTRAFFTCYDRSETKRDDTSVNVNNVSILLHLKLPSVTKMRNKVYLTVKTALEKRTHNNRRSQTPPEFLLFSPHRRNPEAILCASAVSHSVTGCYSNRLLGGITKKTKFIRPYVRGNGVSMETERYTHTHAPDSTWCLNVQRGCL